MERLSVMSNKTFFKQIGGAHYKKKILFAEGNAIKYICRHQDKGKKQDLLKAIHYIEMIIERDYNV